MAGNLAAAMTLGSGAPGWPSLSASIPTRSATARMRILARSPGAGLRTALRDSAYCCPRRPNRLRSTGTGRRGSAEGGQAWLLQVQARDMAEQATFQALFDRAADYATLAGHWRQARQTFSSLSAAELQRLQRKLARTYRANARSDFFSGETSIAPKQWRDFANAIEAMQSLGEPQAGGRPHCQRDRMRYQGVRATRLSPVGGSMWQAPG